MMARKLSVAVLCGGWSGEREVSLASGQSCADALRMAGYDVRLVDVRRDLPRLLAQLTPRPDVIFNALHGTGGEDGAIQGVLEILGLSFTHSGILASALAMNKEKTRLFAQFHDIRVPKGKAFLRQELDFSAADYPLVIKPCSDGSSLNLEILRDPALAAEDLQRIRTQGAQEDILLQEEWIAGRELTVGVVAGQALCVTEIDTGTLNYDYNAKYRPAADGTYMKHICPAQIPTEIADLCCEQAETMHKTLGCQGVTRSDFRWDDTRPAGEGLFFLEINTQPGMTKTSLIPEQIAQKGQGLPEFCSQLVAEALCHS